MEYIAFVTKGLEEIAKNELVSFESLEILEVRQKFIKFNYKGNDLYLKSSRTVDDFGIFIAEIPVNKLIKFELEKELELISKAISHIQDFREIKKTFSITISKYKNKDLKLEELKYSLSQVIANKLSINYTPRNHRNIDLRFSITEDTCLISIKLFQESLYRRDYKHQSAYGSMKSTIAGAMVFEVAKNLKNFKVVDNFCGSGTLLCEALYLGAEIFGGDIDSLAVEITKNNIQKLADKKFQILQLDAMKTNWKDNSFDIAITNFPWDKQIKVHKMYKLLDRSIQEYSRILKAEARVAFISTKPQMVIKSIKKYFDIKKMESYKIGYLGQTPTIIFGEVRKK